MNSKLIILLVAYILSVIIWYIRVVYLNVERGMFLDEIYSEKQRFKWRTLKDIDKTNLVSKTALAISLLSFGISLAMIIQKIIH